MIKLITSKKELKKLLTRKSGRIDEEALKMYTELVREVKRTKNTTFLILTSNVMNSFRICNNTANSKLNILVKTGLIKRSYVRLQFGGEQYNKIELLNRE